MVPRELKTTDLAVPDLDEEGLLAAEEAATPLGQPPGFEAAPPPHARGPLPKTALFGTPQAGDSAEDLEELDSLVEGIDLDEEDDFGLEGGLAPQPAAPSEPRRHKTGELPVSGYLVKGGPAPPPVPSERNAPIECFLCHRPFGPDDLRQGRLRRIQDRYYCLECVQGT